jgi:hypothetical protein
MPKNVGRGWHAFGHLSDERNTCDHLSAAGICSKSVTVLAPSSGVIASDNTFIADARIEELQGKTRTCGDGGA